MTYSKETSSRLVAEAFADDAAMTPGEWRTANGRGSASVTCDDCAIYINVRTVEIDDTVKRWHADAAGIARTRNNLKTMASQLQAAGEFIDGCIQSDRELATLLQEQSHANLKTNLDLARQVNEARADLARLATRVAELEAGLREAIELGQRHVFAPSITLAPGSHVIETSWVGTTDPSPLYLDKARLQELSALLPTEGK